VNIQDRVIHAAKQTTFPSGEFSIQHIQLKQYAENCNPLSYKQIRNALYRVKGEYAIRHDGRGIYHWFLTGKDGENGRGN